jgi:glycosyltransferase involved in cell wall biosynthesis
MRIGINTLSESPGRFSGSADYLIAMTGALARFDTCNEYCLFVSRTNAKWFAALSPNQRLIIAGVSNECRPLRLLSEQCVLPYLARKHLIHVLFTSSGGGVAPLMLSDQTRLVVAVYGTQHLHAGLSVGSLRTWYRRLLGGASIRRAARVIVNSRACREDVLRKLGCDEKIEVVYHGIDGTQFHAGDLTPQEHHRLARHGVRPPYVLFVSTIWFYKNVHTLVEAFGGFITKHGTPHQLVLVGRLDAARGYRDRLVDIARRYGIEERLVFTGPVPNAETRAFYRQADVYVQPSYYETFGKTVVEALACGCPVVGANAGATPEIIQQAGILFDPRSAGQLVEALETVLFKADVRLALVRRGLSRATQFTIENEARKLATIFQEVGAQ